MYARTAERLRKAVAAGAYWEVDQLLVVLRREVEACWKTTQSAERRREISEEVTGLLKWSRHSILAARSHAQNRLNRLSRLHAYGATGSVQPEQLELDA
jgi:phosphoenolpyruvate carboxylase